MTKTLPSEQRYSRRSFLTIGCAGLAGLTLADLLRQEARSALTPARRRAQGVIFIWLGGGPATIDMWDMKPDAPDVIRGEFRPIPTRATGVQVCEHMPLLADVMDKVCLVRSLHHPIPDHGAANIYMATGHPPSPAFEYPSLGSLAARLLSPVRGIVPYFLFDTARATLFGGNAGYLGAAYNPFEVESARADGRPRPDGIVLPEGFGVDLLGDRTRLRDEFDARFRSFDETELPGSLDRFQQQALDILRSPRTRQAFELERETPAVRESYGLNAFGQSVLTARRLIEAGARFVGIGSSRPGTNIWDTHGSNFPILRELLPELDRALAGLIADLASRGLLDSTIVYCVGEFGRTPRLNSNAGRDHWSRSMCALLAGGGMRGGYAHGSTDHAGADPEREPCSPTDVSATIFHLLGFEPLHEVEMPSGRPLAIFREGRVIRPITS